MKKETFLKCLIFAGILTAIPNILSAQTQIPNIEQINNNPTNHNIIFEQSGLNSIKTAEPIIISVPQETQREIITRQISKSISKRLVETNPTILPKDPNNVMLNQPTGKDACDNDKARNRPQTCKNPIEKRANEFENAMRPEINLDNQELSVTKDNNINLSRDANKTAQKITSLNELEVLAAAAVAQTYIAGQTQQPETTPAPQTTLPDNVVDLIENKIQTPK